MIEKDLSGGALADGTVRLSCFQGRALFAHFGKPLKGPDGERREYDRLRHVHPKPEIRPALPNQAPHGIVGPDQGKEDQKPDGMAWDGRHDGVGQAGYGAEYDADKKVEKELGPEKTLRRAVGERKEEG